LAELSYHPRGQPFSSEVKMKIITCIFIQLVVAAVIAGQQTEDWLAMLKDPEYKDSQFKPENQIERYSEHDFSTLLTPRTQFLGYIGEDYQRLKIYFTSVSKSPSDSRTYFINGISVVKLNKSSFTGSIRFTRFIEYKNLRYGIDDRMKDHGIRTQGVLFGTYRFEEDPRHPHSGIFQGSMVFSWYLDVDGVMQYDDIEFHSDSYRNNQFLGTWTKYGSKAAKVANWGEYRIPLSGDLDIGVAEFSPNPDHLDRGWKDRKLY
jgi:hypothetical protein